MHRRHFVSQLLAAVAMPTAALLPRCTTTITPPASPQLPILECVLRHLLPVRATVNSTPLSYIKGLILRREIVDQTDYLRAFDALDPLAQTTFSLPFTKLLPPQRELCLRQFEKTTIGNQCLSITLSLLLEGLLADPIYGGNPGSVGWHWLGFQAGHPRPPIGKRYYELES